MTTTATAPAQHLIGMREVQEMTGLSRSTIDRYAKAASGFPAKIQLTDTGTRQSAIAFVKEEVEAWIKSRMNNRPAANSSEEQ